MILDYLVSPGSPSVPMREALALIGRSEAAGVEDRKRAEAGNLDAEKARKGILP